MISLGVYPDETLHSIKQKIMEKHNLVFDGVRMDNDYATLADYNIQHQSMLDLVEKMQIHVKEPLPGLTFIVYIDNLHIVSILDACASAHY